VVIRALLQVTVLAVAALTMTIPALAHHSFAAEFDENRPVKFSGKVTEMRWSNPHGWIYVDVTGADGKVVNWACELAAVNNLYRRGWRKEDLVTGTVLTLEGWQARNGTPTMNTNTILLPDGRRLFAGAPQPGENNNAK
jgi:hypothetical protein